MLCVRSAVYIRFSSTSTVFWGSSVRPTPLCRGHDSVDDLHDAVQCRVCSDGHIGAAEVVVDGANEPHDVQVLVLLRQPLGDASWKGHSAPVTPLLSHTMLIFILNWIFSTSAALNHTMTMQNQWCGVQCTGKPGRGLWRMTPSPSWATAGVYMWHSVVTDRSNLSRLQLVQNAADQLLADFKRCHPTPFLHGLPLRATTVCTHHFWS